MTTQTRVPTSDPSSIRVPTSDIDVNWSRSGGASNYGNVDEYPSIDDGDYNYIGDTLWDKFGFTAFDIPADSTGIQVTLHIRGGGYDGNYIRAAIWVNGTRYFANLPVLSEGYTENSYTWTYNPDTDLDWTAEDVNTLIQAFGCGHTPWQEVTAVWVSRIYIEVIHDITFEPSTGSDNYALVDEYPATDDDDYLTGYGGDVNEYYPDLLGFAPFTVPVGATINSVKIYMRACCTGTETDNTRMGVCMGINGTTYRDHSQTYPAQTSGRVFAEHVHTFTTNPATTDPWTRNEVNGIGTYGLNYFGGDWQAVDYNGFYSRIYMEVDYDESARLFVFPLFLRGV